MKIAICFPVYGDTRAAFTLSLARMIAATFEHWPILGTGDRPQIEVFSKTGSNVAFNREALVDEADKWNADWLLFADADQTFPPKALLRLLAAGKTVVAANSPRRQANPLPLATRAKGDGTYEPVWSTKAKIEADLLEPVSYVGFSLFLASMEAVRAVAKPRFVITHDLGEDAYFCFKLADCGHPVHVDHRLSASVGHIQLQTLTNDDSLALKTKADIAAQINHRRAAGQRA